MKIVSRPFRPCVSALACAFTCVVMLLSLQPVSAGILTNRVPVAEGGCIVFFGDSITAKGSEADGFVRLVQLAMRQEFLATTVINAGQGWDKMKDLRDRLDNDVLRHRPSVVVIQIGINDAVDKEAESPITQKIWKLGLEDLVWRIRRAGATVVLTTLTVMKERPRGQNAHDEMIEVYSEIVRTVAREKSCYMLELREPFMDYITAHNPKRQAMGILTTDGGHLNKEGNLFLARIILDAFDVPFVDPGSSESDPDR